MNSAHIPSPDDLLRNVPDLTSTTEKIGFQAIAHGGYSDIWRGVERSGGIERDVVVKVIRFVSRDEVDIDRLKKRISREVIACRSLNHINILPFYGLCWLFGYDQYHLPSMVFPYCEAGTCIDYLKGHPNADRTSIVRQVAGALDYLHTLDPPVIHGDIKACNILMQMGGTPMLADFGLSRVMMEGPTGFTTSSAPGSCRWMAPELFGDGETDTIIPVSKASDVWAFGCLCLEVLWDTLPWASIRSDHLIMRAVTSKRQPMLPKGVESTALGRIVQGCWAYKPEDRPNMAQLAFSLLFDDLEPSYSPTRRITITQRGYPGSRTGCRTCRTKKIKCDEMKPICTRCVYGQHECIWPTGGTLQRSRSRPSQSAGFSRSNSGRAASNFPSNSERESSAASTASRETNPQGRPGSHVWNYDSIESRTPGLVPHSGSSLSGLASNDPFAFPQPLDMTSFGSSEVDSLPLSALFGNLPMGYNDQLSMMDQPLSVDSPTSYSPWGPSAYGSSNSIDTSTANGQWSATSNQPLSNPDPIAPFFRSVQERNLVLVSPYY